MRVLLADDSIANGSENAWTYVRMGLSRAFDLCGHSVFLWDTSRTCPIDLFDENEFDLFWGQSYHLDRGLIKVLSENPQTKVVLQAGDWGEWSNKIDTTKYPILKASKSEIENVKKLQTSRPIDLIQAHYHPNDINRTHGLWKDELGIEIGGLPPALDVIDYIGAEPREEFKSDIVYVSGYWTYKAITINKYLIPLCSDLSLNIKIFGNRGWPVPNYCGNLDTRYVKYAFKSAKLNINIPEIHATWEDGVEVNERNFKILGGKNQVLSVFEGSSYRNFFKNGEIEFARTVPEFHEKARAMVAGDLTIDPQKGYDEVMRSHTYFHRIEALFSYLGLENEARNVRNKYKELREVNAI